LDLLKGLNRGRSKEVVEEVTGLEISYRLRTSLITFSLVMKCLAEVDADNNNNKGLDNNIENVVRARSLTRNNYSGSLAL
jgi:hypothetical protein